MLGIRERKMRGRGPELVISVVMLGLEEVLFEASEAEMCEVPLVIVGRLEDSDTLVR